MPTSLRSRSTALAAVVTLVLTALITTSAPAEAATAYRVTAALSAGSVTLGSPVTISGTVSPKAKKKRVVVQTLKKDRWTSISTGTTDAKSAYRVAVRPEKVGSAQYRVCMPASKKIALGCSAAVVVGVFQWRYLYDTDYVDYNDFDRWSVLSINGGRFKKSLSQDVSYEDDDFVEYNVYRKCTTLKMTVGPADDHTDSGGWAAAEVLTDGNSRYSGTLSLGQSTPVTISLSGALRLRIETASSFDGDVSMGYGSPMIYCRF